MKIPALILIATVFFHRPAHSQQSFDTTAAQSLFLNFYYSTDKTALTGALDRAYLVFSDPAVSTEVDEAIKQFERAQGLVLSPAIIAQEKANFLGAYAALKEITGSDSGTGPMISLNSGLSAFRQHLKGDEKHSLFQYWLGDGTEKLSYKLATINAERPTGVAWDPSHNANTSPGDPGFWGDVLAMPFREEYGDIIVECAQTPYIITVGDIGPVSGKALGKYRVPMKTATTVTVSKEGYKRWSRSVTPGKNPVRLTPRLEKL